MTLDCQLIVSIMGQCPHSFYVGSDGSRQKHNTTVVLQDESHLLVGLYWRALTFIFSFRIHFHRLVSSSPCSFPMGKRRNTCTGRGNKQKKVTYDGANLKNLINVNFLASNWKHTNWVLWAYIYGRHDDGTFNVMCIHGHRVQRVKVFLQMCFH